MFKFEQPRNREPCRRDFAPTVISVIEHRPEVAFATPFEGIEIGPTRIWIDRDQGPSVGAPRTANAVGNAEDELGRKSSLTERTPASGGG